VDVVAVVDAGLPLLTLFSLQDKQQTANSVHAKPPPRTENLQPPLFMRTQTLQQNKHASTPLRSLLVDISASATFCFVLIVPLWTKLGIQAVRGTLLHIHQIPAHISALTSLHGSICLLEQCCTEDDSQAGFNVLSFDSKGGTGPLPIRLLAKRMRDQSFASPFRLSPLSFSSPFVLERGLGWVHWVSATLHDHFAKAVFALGSKVKETGSRGPVRCTVSTTTSEPFFAPQEAFRKRFSFGANVSARFLHS